MRGTYILLGLLVLGFPTISYSQYDWGSCRTCWSYGDQGGETNLCQEAWPWDYLCSTNCYVQAKCFPLPPPENGLICQDWCYNPPPNCCIWDPENPYPDYPQGEFRAAPDSVSALALEEHQTPGILAEDNGPLELKSDSSSCASRRPWIFTQDLEACRTHHGRGLSCSPKSPAGG